jgi:hypothetical protein
MSFRIELLGLCGAGKSTFIEAIRGKLELDSSISLGYPITVPVSLTLVFMLKVLASSFLNNPIKMFIFLLKARNWWLIKKIAFRNASVSTRNEESLVLIDSGILQPFLSFEIEERQNNSKIPLHSLLKSITLPDIILDFHVSPSVAKERYEKRGLCGEGRVIRKDSEKYFIAAKKAKCKIVNYCNSNKTIIINIDSSREFNEDYINGKIVEIKNSLNNKEVKI